MNITALIEDWREFFHRELEIEMLDTPTIPDGCEGFERLIIIPRSLMHRQAIRAMEERFGVFCQYRVHQQDPDALVTVNDRKPVDSYGVWVRDSPDADEDFENLSANDIRARGVSGITLLERLVLELKRFVDTGRHCDVDGLTLCTGSRNQDGSVPSVYWASPSARFNIDWVFPHIKGGGLRCRAVIA